MAKTAFIFPGQGSQTVGMGSGICGKYPIAEQRFQEASDILGYSLQTICFEGPIDKLTQTIHTQPAVYVVSAIIHDILRENEIHPSAVAGHSLGEFTALYSAGTFSFGDGLQIVKKRAECMQQAGEDNPGGTMAAIIGFPIDNAKSILDDASLYGIVKIANYNSQMQFVVSGESKAVHEAMEQFRLGGAKRAIELVVGGAFHSPLMSDARDEFEDYLEHFKFETPSVSFYANVTANQETKSETIKQLLSQQLDSPVLWEKSMKNMFTDGLTEFCEVGTGRVLRGLANRILPNAEKIYGFSNLNDLKKEF